MGEGSKFAVILPPHVEEDLVSGKERPDIDNGVVRFLIEAHRPSPAVCPPDLDVHWG
jgi:hypothetical protein